MIDNGSRQAEPRGRRVYVWLDGWQWEALRLLADIDHRQAREQAAWLILAGLKAAGLEVDLASGERADLAVADKNRP